MHGQSVTATFTDEELVRAITTAKSYEAAGRKLKLSPTAIGEHARRLGIRTRFRLGREKLPLSYALMVMAPKARSVEALARKLGVVKETLIRVLDEEGIPRPTMRVRSGLPDDDTLRQDLWSCTRLDDLAEDYGIPERDVRNQLKRLGVPAPSKRGKVQPPNKRGEKEPPARDPVNETPVGTAWRLRGEGMTAAAIARAVGVHEDTVRTWLPAGPGPKILALRERVRELRRKGLGIRATARVVGCSTNFVERWGRLRPNLKSAPRPAGRERERR